MALGREPAGHCLANLLRLSKLSALWLLSWDLGPEVPHSWSTVSFPAPDGCPLTFFSPIFLLDSLSPVVCSPSTEGISDIYSVVQPFYKVKEGRRGYRWSGHSGTALPKASSLRVYGGLVLTSAVICTQASAHRSARPLHVASEVPLKA